MPTDLPPGTIEVPMFLEAPMRRFRCLAPHSGKVLGFRVDSRTRVTLLLIPGPASDVEAGALVVFASNFDDSN